MPSQNEPLEARQEYEGGKRFVMTRNGLVDLHDYMLVNGKPCKDIEKWLIDDILDDIINDRDNPENTPAPNQSTIGGCHKTYIMKLYKT